MDSTVPYISFTPTNTSYKVFIDKRMLSVAQTIANHGGRLYLVGGCVRDILLNKTPNDYDYCVTGLSSQELQTLYPEAIKQGKAFPVYKLYNYDIALARKEKKAGYKHTDFQFDSSPNISIEEDLSRRDFTINSIAIDILSKHLIDPFNGLQDIKHHVLKMTSPAFIEDPLRAYRAARFATVLNFTIEKNTFETMKQMKESLSYLSVERVFTEFRKALNAPKPSIFFDILRQATVLDIAFEPIYHLIGIPQPLLYHPEGDVYTHTMQVLDRVALKTTDELTRFGALVHDFGKIATPSSLLPHHYGHDKLGIPIVHEFCHFLKMPSIFEKAGKLASKEHMLAGIYPTLRPGTKIDFLERIFKSRSLSLEGMELIANCDTSKPTPVHFAKIGKEIMENVKLTPQDIIDNPQFEQRKKKLREKRIQYLLQLEKSDID